VSSDLPVEKMVSDAARLEQAIAGYEGQHHSVAAQVCSHVRKLAADYERLRKLVDEWKQTTMALGTHRTCGCVACRRLFDET